MRNKLQIYVVGAALALLAILSFLLFTGDAPRVHNEPAVPSLAAVLNDEGIDAYARAETVRPFVFPDDHGPHPEYRNEWWYLTGNLDGPESERFGIELTFFRFALAPSSPLQRDNPSAWAADQIFMAHFAVTDVAERKFYFADRYARASAGLAGAQAKPFRVWLENWTLASIEDSSTTWRARAEVDGIALDLYLTPVKPAVFNGDRGLSQKSDKPGNAAYYYSMPRLRSEGHLQINGAVFPVSGLSWLDREWGSSGLSAQQLGWDWFAVQLSDGSDFMFYSLRNRDGSQDEHSAGTWVSPQGDSRALRTEDVTIEVLRYWESPLGGRYPSAWRIVSSALDLDLRLTPVLPNQELDTTPRYWEGAVDVTGQRSGEALGGRGYVELTGYAIETGVGRR